MKISDDRKYLIKIDFSFVITDTGNHCCILVMSSDYDSTSSDCDTSSSESDYDSMYDSGESEWSESDESEESEMSYEAKYKYEFAPANASLLDTELKSEMNHHIVKHGTQAFKKWNVKERTFEEHLEVASIFIDGMISGFNNNIVRTSCGLAIKEFIDCSGVCGKEYPIKLMHFRDWPVYCDAIRISSDITAMEFLYMNDIWIDCGHIYHAKEHPMNLYPKTVNRKWNPSDLPGVLCSASKAYSYGLPKRIVKMLKLKGLDDRHFYHLGQKCGNMNDIFRYGLYMDLGVKNAWSLGEMIDVYKRMTRKEHIKYDKYLEFLRILELCDKDPLDERNIVLAIFEHVDYGYFQKVVEYMNPKTLPDVLRGDLMLILEYLDGDYHCDRFVVYLLKNEIITPIESLRLCVMKSMTMLAYRYTKYLLGDDFPKELVKHNKLACIFSPHIVRRDMDAHGMIVDKNAIECPINKEAVDSLWNGVIFDENTEAKLEKVKTKWAEPQISSYIKHRSLYQIYHDSDNWTKSLIAKQYSEKKRTYGVAIFQMRYILRHNPILNDSWIRKMVERGWFETIRRLIPMTTVYDYVILLLNDELLKMCKSKFDSSWIKVMMGIARDVKSKSESGAGMAIIDELTQAIDVYYGFARSREFVRARDKNDAHKGMRLVHMETSKPKKSTSALERRRANMLTNMSSRELAPMFNKKIIDNYIATGDKRAKKKCARKKRAKKKYSSDESLSSDESDDALSSEKDSS